MPFVGSGIYTPVGAVGGDNAVKVLNYKCNGLTAFPFNNIPTSTAEGGKIIYGATSYYILPFKVTK